MQIVRGFLVDWFLVFTLIYILTRGGTPTRIRTLAGSVAVGLFTFLAGPYTMHNWFKHLQKRIQVHLIDAFRYLGIGRHLAGMVAQ
jgi:hypothetical protein